MQMIKLVLVAIYISFPTFLFAHDYEAISEDLKDGLTQAINHQHYDKIANFFHPNAIIVLGNTHTFHQRSELHQYLSSPASFQNLKISQFTVKQLHIDSRFVSLNKDAFITTGTAIFMIKFANGKIFDVPIRWIATISNEQGKWLITSYQETVDVFDNPIMEQMRHDLYMICFLTLIIGFIIGFTWKKLVRLSK